MFPVVSSLVCPFSRVLPCILAPSPRAFSRRRRRPSFGIVAPPSPSSPPVAAIAVSFAVRRRRSSAPPFAPPTAGAPPTPSTRAAAAFFFVAGRRRSSSCVGVGTVEFLSSPSTRWCPPFPPPKSLAPASSPSRAGRRADVSVTSTLGLTSSSSGLTSSFCFFLFLDFPID